MIYKFILLVTGILLAGIIEIGLFQVGYPFLGKIFGGLCGGLLIGLFIKKRAIFFGALAAICYIVIIFVLLILIGVGTNISFERVFQILSNSLRAGDILKMFVVIICFILGAEIGSILITKK